MTETTIDFKLQNITPPKCSRWTYVDFSSSLKKNPVYSKLNVSKINNIGGIPVIDQGEEFISGYVNDESLIYPGDLPVIIFGDHTIRFKYVNFPFVVGADGTKILSPISVFFPRFYYYYMLSLNIKSQGYSRHYKYLQHIEIPLVSLPHQTLIVDEIEKQLSRLESGLISLQKLQTLVKQYRASVLSSAVSGKLVSQDPTDEAASILLERIFEAKKEKRLAENPSKKYKEPSPIDTSELGDLPDGWCWIKLDYIIIAGPQNGLYKPSTAYGRGMKILRIDDYQYSWIRDREEIRSLEVTDNELKIYGLEESDLIINRVNSMSHLGKSILIEIKTLPCVFESNMMRMKLSNLINVKYIKKYLDSFNGIKETQKGAKQAVNQASINQQDVKDINIPLPPLAEQQRIVAEVERRFSVLDKLEQTITENITRANQLKQSILHQAFSGQLINYDDDPAEIESLLTQIEQAKEEMKKKVKKKNE